MKVSLSLDRSYSEDLSIMVDALRASSTITTALQSFNTVIPVKEINDAEKLAERYGAILAGERDGAKVEGFDAGNSPVDVKDLNGEVLVLTTTNGTRILEDISSSTVLVGSFLNALATASKASELAVNHIEVVMAGVKGVFAIEDFLCAGEIISHLPISELDEYARAAVMAAETPGRVDDAVLNSNSALGLRSLGLFKDVEFCLKRDIYNTVPIYKDGIIKNL
ncbi:MAG TPA: 2-phosphosulfolactate phosphatase [Methanobacterium sp.]|nr:2-phosphosulfolactate phosphatase [Methanobacterium sp.]